MLIRLLCPQCPPFLRYNKHVTRNPSIPFFLALCVLVLFVGAGCSAKATVPDTPTPTPLIIITATLPPTQTPPPSPTLAPPTATPIVAPAEGQTISQLNVRSAPSADSTLLGTVEIFAKVQIVGKDPTGGWWLILYPQSPNGTGWVTAQYVQATNVQNVPVISGGSQSPGNAPGTAIVPAAGAGPTVEVGSVAVPSPAPGPALAIAFPDGDSVQSPAASISLSKVSVRSFNYSSDISFPQGDPEDWVQFQIEGKLGQQADVSVIISCSGSGTLNVELVQNNSVLQGWQNIACGPPGQLLLSLFAGSSYYLHLFPSQANDTLNYVNYTLAVTLR